MLTAEQLRMARAALRITVQEAAELAGVDKGTVVRIEDGKNAYANTLKAIREALEKQGVVFLNARDGEHGPGVALICNADVTVGKQRGEGRSTSSEGGVEASSWDDDFEDFATDQPVTPYIIPISDDDRTILRQRFAEHPDAWNKLSDRAKAVYRRELGL